jgi:hypothetical protein
LFKRQISVGLALSITLAVPAAARDSLGMYDNWGAFRDPAVPRCYAVARAEPSRHPGDYRPYADVASWPRRGLRGEVHFRLSRHIAPNTPITLAIGGQHIGLVGGGGDAWVADPRQNAALIAAMRFNPWMSVVAKGRDNRALVDTWKLSGAASAMDSAAVGCAELH